MVAKSRGVVLIYVLILTVLMVWIGAMFLNAMLSRKVVARNAMASNEIHGVMNAASGLIMSCLASNSATPAPWPTTDCMANPPNITGCLASFGTPPRIGGRPFGYSICNGPSWMSGLPIGAPLSLSPTGLPRTGNPSCRIRIAVCSQTDATCPTPSCTFP
ncbi:MAG: hypothetical protein NTX64_03570 [Elusimicrobia bacterium]|nr:hypothetical protein [Elusimicrobiota bacterium]